MIFLSMKLIENRWLSLHHFSGQYWLECSTTHEPTGRIRVGYLWYYARLIEYEIDQASEILITQ